MLSARSECLLSSLTGSATTSAIVVFLADSFDADLEEEYFDDDDDRFLFFSFFFFLSSFYFFYFDFDFLDFFFFLSLHSEDDSGSEDDYGSTELER